MKRVLLVSILCISSVLCGSCVDEKVTEARKRVTQQKAVLIQQSTPLLLDIARIVANYVPRSYRWIPVIEARNSKRLEGIFPEFHVFTKEKSGLRVGEIWAIAHVSTQSKTDIDDEQLEYIRQKTGREGSAYCKNPVIYDWNFKKSYGVSWRMFWVLRYFLENYDTAPISCNTDTYERATQRSRFLIEDTITTHDIRVTIESVYSLITCKLLLCYEQLYYRGCDPLKRYYYAYQRSRILKAWSKELGAQKVYALYSRTDSTR